MLYTTKWSWSGSETLVKWALWPCHLPLKYISSYAPAQLSIKRSEIQITSEALVCILLPSRYLTRVKTFQLNWTFGFWALKWKMGRPDLVYIRCVETNLDVCRRSVQHWNRNKIYIQLVLGPSSQTPKIQHSWVKKGVKQEFMYLLAVL